MRDWKRQLARARARQQRRSPRVVAYSSEQFSQDEAVFASTRLAGCTCEPDIRIDGQDVHVKHDQWCALLRARRDLS
jgi:hypothetical protein